MGFAWFYLVLLVFYWLKPSFTVFIDFDLDLLSLT